LELLRGIQTAYERATLMEKNRMLKILLNKCELRGKDSTFQWKEPFDILFRLGKVLKPKERGGLVSNFRTFLRQTSIAYQIQSLQSVV